MDGFFLACLVAALGFVGWLLIRWALESRDDLPPD